MLKRIKLRANGFGIEAEITAQVFKRDLNELKFNSSGLIQGRVYIDVSCSVPASVNFMNLWTVDHWLLLID